MKGKVCVTGGSGFIGSWLVKRLLEDGYSVTTTVRSDPGTSRIGARKKNDSLVCVIKNVFL